ncbi:hypothetical protein A3C67_03425 [Candidatus Nomurabacteria bacterium RIFCSPHIGHO2_02_FULL_42_19]|uniref:Bacterial sugar transferase domain-containing protein n=1 Tax=Candidatus Nomurabacteria bacterium RIFCSPHIGHO2_02_FULL_42_19 TaxID=1801756 RepID=A0A1F6W1W8_9BACT|nr:MAG: hypothetical protein A3C67_03425 [Candidatus Nomurabacteria bacterium RIFCSPHIGHO2_02_FULL_42_19]
MKKGARSVLLLLGDMAMLITAFFIMLEVAFQGEISQQVVSSHFMPFVFVFGIWIFVFFLFNLYETQLIKPTIPHLRMIGIASLVAFSTSIILFYIVQSFGIAPKTNLVIFSTIFVILFIGWRRIFCNIFSINFRKSIVCIVDQNKNNAYVKEIINYIETYPQSGFYVLGIYSSLDEFTTRQAKTQVDTLIVSKDSLKKTGNLILIYNNVKNILDLTYAYENILGKIPVDSIDETWFLHNVQSTNTTSYNIITYFINIAVSLIVLTVTFPFLLVVALLIKLYDRGSIFYTQLRVGKENKTFKLYKFRSMIMNSESNGAVWAGKNDNRITPMGKIIRKLHIDEIPQMINVLKGDLSLVGPRPERLEFVVQLENTIPHYEFRHIIRPGFTGWAQIKYRYANTVENSKEKFQYDLFYIKNRNIFMDFGIILRTIQIIFTH